VSTDTALKDTSPRMPPGPRTPALLQTVRLIRDPDGYLRSCQERYGDAITLRLIGFGETVCFSDREAVRQIFSESEALPIGPVANVIRDIVGEHSPTQVDGDPHRRLRRLLAPLFMAKVVEGYLPVFKRAAEREFATWKPGETIVLREALQRVTLDQIVEIAFGFEDATQRHRMAEAVDDVRAGSRLASLGEWAKKDLGPWSPWGRFLRRRKRLDEMLYEQIEERRRTGPIGTDMLSQLLVAERESDDEPFTRDELRDQLKSLVMGGHETVATAVSWATGLLLHNPGHIDRIVAEARTGGTEFTEATIQEAMRIQPPIVATGRYTSEPTRIGRWLLPEGIRVWIPAGLIHHDPTSYSEPDQFRPDRFMGTTPSRGAWVPFGGGPHRCVGAGFARHQTRELLQSLLAYARLRPVAPELERAKAENVISVPEHGMRVVYEGRRA
jgi:cytochrome P450